ncbi:coiled-coil domain-containing protein 66-like isoform X2 [Liolophura sinensis]|uniref:coiled-coil domain-containing protein 66-like isoform X2 n=1 Tax=Liolophura sinensis TaxID=3198878 RepID=UPI00315807B9
MSFGASGSLRFDVGNHGRDQGIFWQAGSQKKPAKKFGYKKKEMKYPLRKIGPAETVVEHNEVKNNQQNKSHRKNFVRKNKENASNLMRTKDGISKENGGYYTLTHKQLNAILQSVGKIASLRGEGVNIAIDPLTNELKIDPTEVTDSGNDENKEQVKESETFDATKEGSEHGEAGECNSGEVVKEVESPRLAKTEMHNSKQSEDQTTARSETKSRKTRKQKQKVSEEAREKENQITEAEVSKVEENQTEHRFSPPPIPRSHMTKAEKLRQEMRQNQDKNESVRGLRQSSDDPTQKAEVSKVEKRRDRNPLTNSRDETSPIKFHIPPLIPKAHLTMAEKKRLQWEIERGETINTPPSTKKTTSSADKVTPREEKSKEKENDDRKTVDQKDNSLGGSEPLKMLIPKAHLSQAERKRLQWELEKAEQKSVVSYDPWGRPGAGAPIRTNSGKPLADYKSRKEQALRLSLEARQEPQPASTNPSQAPQSPDSQSPSKMMANQSHWTEPAAMRSSFAIGFIAPNEERFKSTKEEERRKWLEDLEKQREERRLQKLAEKEKDRQYFQETWADKLTHEPHPPAPLPDQTASLTPRTDYPHTQPATVLTPRVGSAPQATTSGFNDSKNYTRGQGSLLDPSTIKEMEEKRRRHLEHQAAVLAQVEENQKLKRLERERKIQEELEEERKLQQERDVLQNQYKEEQKKSRLKEEARQRRLLELKNAMDEAHYNAQQEKHMKRMQHLQQGGHDIKRLQATIEDPIVDLHQSEAGLLNANLTPRPTARHVEPTSVPGLDLTPRLWHPSQETTDPAPAPSPAPPPVGQEPLPAQTQHKTAVERYHHEPYTENRVLTPSLYRKPVADPLSPRRDFSTQTDFNLLKEDVTRQNSEVSIVYKEKKQPAQNKKVRVKSADKNVDSNLDKQNKKPPMGKKGPLKISERPKWGTQNQKQAKNKKQSERDPFYQRKIEERRERRARRERELLASVEANKRMIPGEKGTGHREERVEHVGGSNRAYHDKDDLFHGTDRSGQYDRLEGMRRQTQSPPMGRTRDRSPTTNYRGDSRTTVITTHAHSPPIPALRHKMDIWKDSQDFVNDYQLETHSYNNYHSSQPGQTQVKPSNSHYQDDPFEDAPFEPSDFIPFTRTSEVLDPGRAAVPVIVSRESSAVTRARNEYHKGQQPGHHGNQMEYYDDKKYQILTPVQKDPILNPNVVKGHPTPRQDLILQQLSHLKLNLMQRQRELETCMSPSDLTQP